MGVMLDLPAHFGPEWGRKPIGDSGGIDLRQKRLIYLIVALNSCHLVFLKFRKMRPSRAMAPASVRNRLVRVLPSSPTYHPRHRPVASFDGVPSLFFHRSITPPVPGVRVLDTA